MKDAGAGTAAQEAPKGKPYPEHGKVIAAHLGTETVGSAGVVGSLKRWVYRVDCGDLYYDLQGKGKSSLSIGQDVDFRIEKEKAYLNDGKSGTRYRVVGTGKSDPKPSPQSNEDTTAWARRKETPSEHVVLKILHRTMTARSAVSCCESEAPTQGGLTSILLWRNADGSSVEFIVHDLSPPGPVSPQSCWLASTLRLSHDHLGSDIRRGHIPSRSQRHN